MSPCCNRKRPRFLFRGHGHVWFALLAACSGLLANAAAPSPEKLLPDDTLLMVTAPDFDKLCDLWAKSVPARLWNDPAMRPFRDKFVSKWQEQFIKPLQRDLDAIELKDYASLLEGQLTFALTRNGWQGQDGQSPGVLLLADTKEKSAQSKKRLAQLRQKWTESGKAVRIERIHGIEFMVLSVSTNDVPKTWRRFFPGSSPVEELGDENAPKKPQPKSELVIGQADSLIIAGNSLQAVEKLVVRLSGGSLPTLDDLAAYQANHLALFRDAPVYGWINIKAFIDIWKTAAAQKKDNPEAPNPLDIKPERILKATGISGLNTIAFSIQPSTEGTLFQVFFGAPESSRQGLFKLLAGAAKETKPPSFVPADAVKFRRWRMDGPKAWATIEQALGDLSPQAIGTLNFVLDSANAYARQTDPGFDVRKSLLGNVGDDIIFYKKKPRSSAPADLDHPPSLILIGSPNAEEMAASMKSILIFMSQQPGTPPEAREFLGRKIYSAPLAPMALPLGVAPRVAPAQTLYYAATSGYLALSTDVSILEEHLRTTEEQGKALGEASGLAEAAQKVITPSSSLFGYQNLSQTARNLFEAWRQQPKPSAPSPVFSEAPFSTANPGAPVPSQGFSDWADFSLLPEFDKVSNYFYFIVYGGGATSDGLAFSMFAPRPPNLNNVSEPKHLSSN